MPPDNCKPCYWAVLPAGVRYDAVVPPNAKLLYAEISALCDAKGYCYASNDYFCSNFEFTDRTVRRLLTSLAEQGYIRVDVIRDQKTNEVIERRIYAGINPASQTLPPSGQKCPEGSGQKSPHPSGQKCPVEQDIYINNTPIPPKGRRRAVHLDAPAYLPERFERFWQFYPKKQSKQDAMRAWDKLQPDEDLLRIMGASLKLQKVSEEYTRENGRFIPLASTWLNGRKWEDELTYSDDPDDEEPEVYGWRD